LQAKHSRLGSAAISERLDDAYSVESGAKPPHSTLVFAAILDLLRELFNLLGFFDHGNGKSGIGVGFLDLFLKFGDHFKELLNIRSDLDLVLLVDGLGVGSRGIGIADAVRKVSAGGVWVKGSARESGAKEKAGWRRTSAALTRVISKWRLDSGIRTSWRTGRGVQQSVAGEDYSPAPTKPVSSPFVPIPI
jgi:hypothetical protein